MLSGYNVTAAIDFSAGSDEALRQADAFARAFRARLIAIHVVPSTSAFPVIPQLTPNPGLTSETLRRATAAVVDRVCSLTGRSESDFDVVTDSGAVESAIVHKAAELSAKIVAIGAHGATTPPKLFGSTAERVVRHATVPVLVARKSPSGGRVLAATDLLDPALPAVEAAVAIARSFGSKLTLVHNIDTPPAPVYALSAPTGNAWAAPPAEVYSALRSTGEIVLETVRDRYAIDAEVVVTEGHAAHEIAKLAQREDATLIVLGTHGRTGIRRFVLGSVAETVAREAPCSVLVLAHPHHSQ